jgi:hypothetical protein
MKMTVTFEITEKELALALLPNGGTIKEVKIEDKPTRRRRTTAQSETKTPKPRASRKKTAKTEEA